MAVRRGTTNTNVRGSSYSRSRRKWWLIAKFESPIFGAGWTHCYVLTCQALLCYDTITVDRIIPGCQGGTYRRTNIRPACGRCNSSTGAVVRGSITPREERRRKLKIDELVRLMEPRRYTRRQAAKLINKSEDTLAQWKRKKVFVPTETKAFGQLVVDLYTEEDIVAMKTIAKSIKPGRRPATKIA